MKKILFLAAIAVFLIGCTSAPPANGEKPILRVYTYDSLAADYGLGPIVVPKFEAECGCTVELIAAGDAGQVLSRLVLEKNNPKADLVIGIDNTFKEKAIEAGVLEKFTPENISVVPQELRFDKEGYLTPYDYGFMAFVYDKTKIRPAPQSFEDLLDERFRDRIVIENPRTSSPGLALLLWTVAVYGENGFLEYWAKLKPNILTVTAGWDGAAGLFGAGEAPVYLSYATSPPYYVQFEENENFLAAEFKEGHFLQVEGMAIVKGTQKQELAGQFIEFALTEKFQAEIPLTQFMFPVNENVQMPESFDFALRPAKTVSLDEKLVDEKQEEWISQWETVFS